MGMIKPIMPVPLSTRLRKTGVRVGFPHALAAIAGIKWPRGVQCLPGLQGHHQRAAVIMAANATPAARTRTALARRFPTMPASREFILPVTST